MNNWKQVIIFLLSTICLYNILSALLDFFFIKYIIEGKINLQFIQGIISFMSLYVPYIFIKNFNRSNKPKEHKID